jgi:hypothetical protein
MMAAVRSVAAAMSVQARHRSRAGQGRLPADAAASAARSSGEPAECLGDGLIVGIGGHGFLQMSCDLFPELAGIPGGQHPQCHVELPEVFPHQSVAGGGLAHR